MSRWNTLEQSPTSVNILENLIYCEMRKSYLLRHRSLQWLVLFDLLQLSLSLFWGFLHRFEARDSMLLKWVRQPILNLTGCLSHSHLPWLLRVSFSLFSFLFESAKRQLRRRRRKPRLVPGSRKHATARFICDLFDFINIHQQTCLVEGQFKGL